MSSDDKGSKVDTHSATPHLMGTFALQLRSSYCFAAVFSENAFDSTKTF